MIKVDGKVERLEPDGFTVTNVREFKIGEESYIAIIHHYESNNYHNVSVRIFKEVSGGFDSALATFEKEA